MTLDRLAAVTSERNAVVDFLGDLTDVEWDKPSRCEGWSVKDVVSHLGAAAHGFFTPWVVGLLVTGDIEGHNDRDAARRRGWEPKQVLTEYEKWSKRAGVIHGAIQKPVLRGLPVRLGELGTYPAALLTSAIVFDSHLHLRHDIASALGRVVPPGDANCLAVTLEWMFAGLSPMSGDNLAWLDRPVEINLVGAAGGTWTVTPGTKGRVAVAAGSATGAASTVEGDAAAFPLWGTRRQLWREGNVSLKGDQELGSRFLDSMRII